MHRAILIVAAASALAASSSGPVMAAPYVPGEVVVKYADGTSRTARASVQRATGTRRPRPLARLARTLRLRPGQTVRGALTALRARPEVEYAVPNYLAHASFIPNDPGRGRAADWRKTQWNFLAGIGVNAPDAWDHVAAAGRPGGAGVVVAVLDTGVAYSNRDRFRRSPDFSASRFVRGYDFVSDDPWPDDQNGHGTHVAGTIAERANNGVALTGLAYGARIMPVRVLNALGEGDAARIADGIRFAARQGAQVINLSLEFSTSVTADQIPQILEAVRYASRRGVVIVGAAGNAAEAAIAYPARATPVIAVGATTEHGCLADYSNDGPELDLVAPGGGADASIAEDPACRPGDSSGRDIFQLTFDGSVRRFGLPTGYEGTSMAAPHVSAAAALVIASGVLGPRPSPEAVERRLEETARDLGPIGPDRRYGAGLLDAGAATAPVTPPPPAPEPPAPAPAPAP